MLKITTSDTTLGSRSVQVIFIHLIFVCLFSDLSSYFGGHKMGHFEVQDTLLFF